MSNSTIIERLLSRAESYYLSGPSAKHTADLLRDAANEIAALKSRIEIPASSQPRGAEELAVEWQYRYRHQNPNAIWSGWGPHNPSLSSYPDFDEEKRPIYDRPPPYTGEEDCQ